MRVNQLINGLASYKQRNSAASSSLRAAEMTTVRLFLFAVPLLALGFLLAPLTTQSLSPLPCNRTRCPIPTCADPDYSVDRCCGSCAQSNCTFRGCVRHKWYGVQWSPEPCTTCSCSYNDYNRRDYRRESCHTTTSCPDVSDCENLGYRIVKHPWQCCPECDYGIPLNTCAPVKDRKENVTVTVGESKCQIEVVFHKCDKPRVFRHRVYTCRPIMKNRSIKLRDGGKGDCESTIRRVILRDVTLCRIDKRSIWADVNPPNWSCAAHCNQTGCTTPPA